MIQPNRRFATWLAILAVVIASSGAGAMWAYFKMGGIAAVYEGWRTEKFLEYKKISSAFLYFSAGAFPTSVLLSLAALIRECLRPRSRLLLPLLALVISLLSAIPLLFVVWAMGQV